MGFLPGQDRVISVRKLAAVRTFVESEGLEWQAIATRLGFDPLLTDRIESMVPIRLLMRLLDHLAEVMGDDAVGLRIGLAAPIGAAGLFGYIAGSASSLREAIANWVRYHDIPTNAFTLRFEETERAGLLRWDIPDCYGPRAQLVGVLIGYMVAHIRYMLADPSASPRVSFSHGEPAAVATYETLLGSDIAFDQPVDGLDLPRQWLDVVPQGSDPALLRLLEQAAERLRQGREAAADAVFLVTRHVMEGLDCGGPTIEAVAARMGMSVRSLQRLLEANGTSFRELSDKVRQEVALRYLRETERPISEIADLTGFCDHSAFSRAVRGWFEASPVEVRARGVRRP
jgi:AraC-like DNA-binding protein